jgi:AcrR family transcriptional regulator
MRIFARKGVENTKMQDIAADAGLSAGAIYRYYSNQEDVLQAVFADCTERNRALFEQKAATTGSPFEALDDIGRDAWSEFKNDGAHESIILTLETALAAARQPDKYAVARREMLMDLAGMLGRLVRRAQTAGEIDAGVNAEALAHTLLACHLGCGVLALQLGDEVDTDAVYEIVYGMTKNVAPEANQPARRKSG